MSRDTGVIEDGVTAEPSRRSGNPGWVLALTGFVVGLGLGVLVVNPSSREVTPTPTSAPVAGVGAPTTLAAPSLGADGVAGEVPDFPDTVIAIARTTGSALDHLLWPRQGELRVRSMAGGSDVLLDTSARFIAMSGTIPNSEGVVLSMGRYNQIGNVSNDVTSYVWHDGVSGVLGYTTYTDGVWRLYDVKPSLRSRLILETTEFQGSLVAFGDWGWAVQTSPDEMSLLTPDGSFKAVEAGVGFASHPTGWIFMMSERPKLVSAGGGVVQLDADLQVGAVTSARFSPDGSKIAIGGVRGWSILDVATQTVDNLGLTPSSLAWSSDSRFALAAPGSGVAVYDLETGTPYPLLLRDSVLAVGTAPLNAPDS